MPRHIIIRDPRSDEPGPDMASDCEAFMDGLKVLLDQHNLSLEFLALIYKDGALFTLRNPTSTVVFTSDDMEHSPKDTN